MSGVYIEVNQEDVRRVQKKLKDLEKAPQKLKNAINRTATQTKKYIHQGRKAGYRMQAGPINSSMTIWRATASRLDAVIKERDRPHSLMNKDRYKISAKNGKGMAGVYKGGMKPLSAGPVFTATMSNGHSGIFQRTEKQGIKKRLEKFSASKHTQKIKTFQGPGAAKVVESIYLGRHGGQEDMEGRIREKLHEEMLKEIKKLM